MKDKICEDCGNPMTLLLNSYVCDWCDGLVVDEWDKTFEDVTEPYKWVNLLDPLSDSNFLESSSKTSKRRKKKSDAEVKSSGSLESWRLDIDNIPCTD